MDDAQASFQRAKQIMVDNELIVDLGNGCVLTPKFKTLWEELAHESATEAAHIEIGCMMGDERAILIKNKMSGFGLPFEITIAAKHLVNHIVVEKEDTYKVFVFVVSALRAQKQE